MEKGLKTLHSTARTAHRRASASYQGSFAGSAGNSDHHSDSGIGLGSDVEVEAGDESRPSDILSEPVVGIWPATYERSQHQTRYPPSDHSRSRSLSYTLPLYKPPPLPTFQRRQSQERAQATERELQSHVYRPTTHAPTPAIHSQHRVMGIQSMLAPASG